MSDLVTGRLEPRIAGGAEYIFIYIFICVSSRRRCFVAAVVLGRLGARLLCGVVVVSPPASPPSPPPPSCISPTVHEQVAAWRTFWRLLLGAIVMNGPTV